MQESKQWEQEKKNYEMEKEKNQKEEGLDPPIVNIHFNLEQRWNQKTEPDAEFANHTWFVPVGNGLGMEVSLEWFGNNSIRAEHVP